MWFRKGQYIPVFRVVVHVLVMNTFTTDFEGSFAFFPIDFHTYYRFVIFNILFFAFSGLTRFESNINLNNYLQISQHQIILDPIYCKHKCVKVKLNFNKNF